MPRAGHLICWAMALLVAMAPLPFGSVHPVPLAVVQVAVALVAAVWVTLRMRAGITPLPWNDPLLIGGGAIFAYGLLQITPIPVGILSVLSPQSAALKASFSPVPPAWASLSIDPYATWHACLLTACWTLAAVIVRHNAVDLKGRLTLAGGLVAGGLFQAGYGLFEFISGRQKILWYQKVAFTDVATGTFISRNNYAAYLEMALPFALALALFGNRHASHGRRFSIKRRLAGMTGRKSFRSILLLMTAFLMAIALLMSRSRMGIASITLALLAGVLALALRGRSGRFALVSVTIIGGVALFASQIDIIPLVERFRLVGGEFGTGYNRMRVWSQAVPMLSTYKTFGSGMGTWEMAFSPFRDDAAQIRVDFAHNDYLEFAAESGAIGVLIIFCVVLLFGLSRKRRQSVGGGHQDEIGLAAGIGLIAVGLHSVTDFHLSIPADALAVTVLLGLFLRPAGPASPLTADGRTGPRRGGVLRAPAWALCTATILALGLAAISPAAAHVTSQRSAAAIESVGDVDATPLDTRAASPDDDLCPACRLEPFNSARYVEATARARRRLLRDVETLVRAWTVGIFPSHGTKTYLAGRIDRTLDLVHEGLQLAPARARGHFEEGLLHFGRFALTGLPPSSSEEFDRAVVAFTKGLTLAPWQAAWHRKVALVTLPLFEQCNESQKRFVEQTARRARLIDPKSVELKTASARLGF